MKINHRLRLGLKIVAFCLCITALGAYASAGGFAVHIIRILENTSAPFNGDSILFGELSDVAYGAGSGAGATVTVAITKSLPPTYNVQVTGNATGCYYTVTSKTSTGFNVIVTPFSGSTTISAGTFDVLITK